MKYLVEMARTQTHTLTIEVEADSVEEAEVAALEECGNHDFREGTSSEAGYEILSNPVPA